jgi:hypothetical protein
MTAHIFFGGLWVSLTLMSVMVFFDLLAEDLRRHYASR